MPPAKVPSKVAPSQEKAKRKRVDFDVEVISNDKPTIQKPTKKLRKDDTGTNAESSKQKAKAKGADIADITPKETNNESKPRPSKKSKSEVKDVTKTEDASTKDGITRKVKKTSLRPDTEPSSPTIDSDEVEVDLAQAEEEEIHLQGFSSESDSSDEELDDEDTSPFSVSELPSVTKDNATLQQKIQQAKRHPTEDRGVVYLGRIPHGFYENEMRAYFTQFGDVTRLRLSRNKKTGRSKHYGFIEFSSSTVAEIVAETMNNYLLLGHILQCRVIPKDQIHPELWIGANKKWRVIPQDRVARVKQNKSRTPEEQKRAESKLLARQKKRQAKILASGIQYDFQDVAYKQKIQEVI